MKNDLAFVLMGTLNLYEHQSTFSANMPIRFLIYLAEEYQKLVDLAECSLYGTKQIFLPTPQCVVFYNGEKEMPEEKILRLSDAFENKEREADIELKVRILNINHGYNEALNMAIDYCIDHAILFEFLKTYRAEVLGMLLEEFDAEKYERTIREEGDAGRLVHDVKSIMKRLNLSLCEACDILEVTTEQYEEAVETAELSR